jgi:hypothetical protein
MSTRTPALVFSGRFREQRGMVEHDHSELLKAGAIKAVPQPGLSLVS